MYSFFEIFSHLGWYSTHINSSESSSSLSSSSSSSEETRRHHRKGTAAEEMVGPRIDGACAVEEVEGGCSSGKTGCPKNATTTMTSCFRMSLCACCINPSDWIFQKRNYILHYSIFNIYFKKCDSNPFWVIYFAQIPSDKIPLMSHARHMYDV